MRQLSTMSWLVACALVAAGTAGCHKDDDNNTTTPTTDSSKVRPSWGPTLDDSSLVVIRRLEAFNAPPIETLSPQQARMQPGFADAVKAIISEHGIMVPVSQVDTSGVEIPVTGGTVHARIYRPKGNSGRLPVIVYYHGGGYVIATNDTYDASARGLCEKSGMAVMSVEYRKAPEFKFPTAHNDAFQAYKWVANNGNSVNLDQTKLALAGESAGGNLACAVAVMARDSNVTMPKHQVLVYPIANNDANTESMNKYAAAKPLNKPQTMYFLNTYLNNMSESADPRIKLIAANLNGLPPTTIINAEIDPLRDDGAALETALRAAGVLVTRRLYDGVTHEFFGAAAVIPTAKEAQDLAAQNLKTALQ